MVVRVPRPLSVGEEMLALHMDIRAIKYVREYEFCPGREFRFDFAILGVPRLGGASLAIEVEGGSHSRGRHVRAGGFAADLEKYNLAAMLGWVLLRYTTQMVRSGAADKQIAEVMGLA